MSRDTTLTTNGAAGTTTPGSVSRLLGVVLAPRETFEQVARAPRWLVPLAIVAAVGAAAVGGFLFTEVGQQAWLDRAVMQQEDFGFEVSDEQYARMEAMAPAAGYLGIAQMTIGVPLIVLCLSGILYVVFNVVGGGDATFRQLFAVVVHSTAIWALGWLFVTPLNYARESLSSPTNAAVFFPMLDEGTLPARLLGMIDLFLAWWVVVLAIGLAVLYRRRTRPIAIALFIIYAVIAAAVAGVMTAMGGA
jgi:hypothetical protein